MRESENQDNGCVLATQFLGRRSHCLECPFNDCRYDEVEQLINHRRKERQRQKKLDNMLCNTLKY